jgi:hypothetical protein
MSCPCVYYFELLGSNRPVHLFTTQAQVQAQIKQQGTYWVVYPPIPVQPPFFLYLSFFSLSRLSHACGSEELLRLRGWIVAKPGPDSDALVLWLRGQSAGEF